MGLITTQNTGYLEDPYLEDPYLGGSNFGNSGLQFEVIIESFYGLQFTVVQSGTFGLQFEAKLYNTDNLRILCDFPSRGTSGENWTSNSTAPGDFSPYNLNTDVIEEVWRSDGAITGVSLTCDTELPQGVFLDTLAILGHNLTTSATVILLGSMDPTFATVGVSITLEARANEMYYIPDTFPSEGFRYWRLSIDDDTNPAGYLQIGVVVFGNALIFQGECFVEDVDFGFVDFADTVRTAGHTNAANSRAVKKSINLEFRSLDFTKGNFRAMRAMFLEERTILKCLWIPTPDPVDQEYTSRFAVFAKLTQIPREKHKSKGRNADYIGFTVELDESR